MPKKKYSPPPPPVSEKPSFSGQAVLPTWQKGDWRLISGPNMLEEALRGISKVERLPRSQSRSPRKALVVVAIDAFAVPISRQYQVCLLRAEKMTEK